MSVLFLLLYCRNLHPMIQSKQKTRFNIDQEGKDIHATQKNCCADGQY